MRGFLVGTLVRHGAYFGGYALVKRRELLLQVPLWFAVH